MARRNIGDIEIIDIEKLNKKQSNDLVNSIIDFMEIENWDNEQVTEGWGEDGKEEKETSKRDVDCNILIDISKIKPLKFTKNVEIPFYEDINKFADCVDGYEGYYSSYAELSFLAYKFNKINGYYPSSYRFDGFDVNRFLNELFKNYDVPKKSYIKVAYQGQQDKQRLTSLTIAFKQDFVIMFDGPSQGCVYYNEEYYDDKESILYTFLGLLKGVKKPKVSQNKIFIVYRSAHGFDKIGFDVKKIKVDLDENYNDDFAETSDEIIKGLNSKQKTNLVILSGEAGTGKTTYIRHLTSKLKKNIIFISPDMVDSITDPAFIPFLMNNNDSVLIIEDAEPALEKRNQGGRSSAVSNVLNLTDGLLSDCLKISIVATFNTNTKNLDDALLRRGRLLMNYKFEKLSVAKSKLLLKKLGHDEIEVKHPMTLADIYFYGTDNNTSNLKNKGPVTGFKQNI